MHAGGMIRTHYTRQTAMANSTPPVRDNYWTGRGLAELPRCTKVWLPKMEVSLDRDLVVAASPFCVASPVTCFLFNLLT